MSILALGDVAGQEREPRVTAPIRGSLAGSVAWAGLESGLSLAISVGSTLIVARLLGAAEFGLGALAYGLVQIPLVVVGALVHDGLVQRARLDAALWRAGRLASLAAGLLLGLLVLASAPLLAAFFDEPRLAPLIAAMAPLLLLDSINIPLLAARRRALDFAGIARCVITARAAGALGGIALALAGGRAWAIVAQQTITLGVTTALLLPGAPRFGRGPLDRAGLLDLLRFCRPIVWTQLLIQGSERLFLAYVGHRLGLAAAGYWSLASRLVENLAAVVGTALYHVGLAHLSRLQAERAVLAARLDQGVRLLMLAVVPTAAALLVGAERLITLTVGADWTPATPAVQLLALGAVLAMRRLLPTVALTAAGRSRTSLEAYLAENGLTLPLLFLLAPVALPAVAGLRAVRALFGWAVVARAAARGLDRSWRKELRGLAVDGAALAAGVAGGLALDGVFRALLGPAALPLLVVTASGAAAAAALTALALQPALARELAARLSALRAGRLGEPAR